MPRRGEELQHLVRAIEMTLNMGSNISVESPKMLRDMDTGRMREHDVVITFRQSHHTLLVALECKKWNGKVGSPEVEAFHGKCLRTGIHRGIIVSSTGFTEPGIKKSHALGIGCMNLQEAIGFDWCIGPGISFHQRELLHVNVVVDVGHNPEPGAALHSETGGPVDQEMLKNIASNCMSGLPTSELFGEPTGKEIVRSFVDNNPNFFVSLPSGERTIVRSMTVYIKYIVNERLIPFEFHTYENTGGQEGGFSVASGPLQAGQLQGRLMIIHQEELGAQIVFVPEQSLYSDVD